MRLCNYDAKLPCNVKLTPEVCYTFQRKDVNDRILNKQPYQTKSFS